MFGIEDISVSSLGVFTPCAVMLTPFTVPLSETAYKEGQGTLTLGVGRFR